MEKIRKQIVENIFGVYRLEAKNLKTTECFDTPHKHNMNMFEELVFPLKCEVQTYAWGKHGSNSEVAALSKNADPTFPLKEDAPYAELWMGTHPNGPSRISKSFDNEETPLNSWIKNNGDKLGSKVNEEFNGELPYLFKVLSVNKSLSIQAHPNKVHAEKLHSERPDVYKDPNHKPEMCIALTPFKAMCGFRPIKEVAEFMKEIDEFRDAVGAKHFVRLMTASRSTDMVSQYQALKDSFTGLMEQDKEVIVTELNKLVEHVSHLQNDGINTDKYVGDVLLKLNEEFPGDVGCFAIYFLNIVTLHPGEAMFLEANLPHAYLSGDCMECMACSDNVVRAGLTPKLRDVHTLCEMLDYTSRIILRTKFKGVTTQEKGATITSFRPPVKDFAVTKYEIHSECDSYKLCALDSASICIVIQGEGHANNRTLKQAIDIYRGSVFFVSANEKVELSVTPPGMLLFRAFAGL